MRRWYGTLLLPLVAGAWFCFSGRGPHTSSPPRQSAAVPAATHASSVRQSPAERPWARGVTHTYQVESTTSTTLFEGRGGAPITMKISGRMSMAVLGEDDGTVELRGELREASVTVGRSAEGARLGAAISEPFLVRVDPTGALREVLFEGSVPVEGRQIVTALVAALRLSHEPSARSWTASERDGVGEYVGQYRRDANQVTRTLPDYQRVWSADGLVSTSTTGSWTVHGTTVASYEQGMWPTETRSAGKQIIVQRAPDIRSSHEWVTRARLWRVERGKPAEAPRAGWAASLQGPAESARVAFARAKRNADENHVGDASFGELLGTLERAKTRRERSRAMARMAALMRLDPSTTRGASAALASGLDEESRSALLGALGSAGTPEAQRVLADIAGSTGAAPLDRSHALALLGASPNQAPENLEVIQAALRDDDPNVRNNAALALGNSAQALGAQGLDSGDAALDALRDRLAAAREPSEIVATLAALGHAGDERALPLIEPFLHHGLEEIRGAAISALHLLPGDRPEALLAAAATHEQASRMRKLAVQALGYRALSALLLAVLEDRALHDEAPLVRRQVASVLARHAAASPKALALLRALASGDSDADVRAHAASLLPGPG